MPRRPHGPQANELALSGARKGARDGAALKPPRGGGGPPGKKKQSQDKAGKAGKNKKGPHATPKNRKTCKPDAPGVEMTPVRVGCATKALGADYLLARYDVNVTEESHARALASAVEGNLAIGSTTELIPEANDAARVGALVVDGLSGDARFPHGDLKALFTVGEVNMCDNEHFGDVYVGES